jgi:ferric-dicitrate binding protein FerR (iron transport regulator)
MTFRAKETAQSTVRAINELVGEATDKIEDVLPKMDTLPKKIENVLPKRRKRRARRRTIGALLAAGVAAAIAFFALRSRRQITPATTSSSSAGTPTGSANRRSDTVSDFDRDREPAVSHN